MAVWCDGQGQGWGRGHARYHQRQLVGVRRAAHGDTIDDPQSAASHTSHVGWRQTGHHTRCSPGAAQGWASGGGRTSGEASAKVVCARRLIDFCFRQRLIGADARRVCRPRPHASVSRSTSAALRLVPAPGSVGTTTPLPRVLTAPRASRRACGAEVQRCRGVVQRCGAEVWCRGVMCA